MMVDARGGEGVAVALGAEIATGVDGGQGHAPAPRRAGAPYRQYLLVDWLSVIPLATSVWGVVFNLWTLVAAAVLAEAAFVALGPYVGPLRRRVEARLECERLVEAALHKQAQLSRLPPELRREFERLEALADRARESRRWPSPRAAERLLGLNELLDAFLRLSIDLKAGNDLLAGVDRDALADERDELERSAGAAPEGRRRAMRQRASVVARRVAHWDQTRERLVTIEHQLATLSGAVKLVHEQCVAPGAREDVGGVLGAALGRFEHTEALLREFGAYADDEHAQPPCRAIA
ncbi:MAG TPA: hypothetical protein VFS43_17695 [Polyangiaceae bacterium]|nr:hypothetical protein [Polyangiaceae bacterium]